MKSVAVLILLLRATLAITTNARDNATVKEEAVSNPKTETSDILKPALTIESSPNSDNLLVEEAEKRKEDESVGQNVSVSNETNNSSIVFSPSNWVCTQKDSAGLNQCLQQLLKFMRPRLAGGIPEMNLPPLEPLQLENVSFEQGSGAVKVVSHFMNVVVSGIANFTQFDFWVDVSNKTLDFDIIFPQLSLVGVYQLSGNLFFIPIGGTGSFHLHLGGTKAKGQSQLSVARNATATHVLVRKTDVNLEMDTIKVHLSNLFNGDPVLGTFMNNFLNENAQEVFAEIKPQIGAQVGELLSLLANRTLSALSTTSLFDEAPFSPTPTEEKAHRV